MKLTTIGTPVLAANDELINLFRLAFRSRSFQASLCRNMAHVT